MYECLTLADWIGEHMLQFKISIPVRELVLR
jgi:hypothetical protein